MVFEKKKKNLALVLSGGASRGLAHIGVLEVLEENHIPIEAIVGTSMGALIGGLYAAGSLNDFKKEIINLSNSRIKTLFFSRRLMKMDTDSTRAIGPFLNKFIKDKKIEELGIDFTAVATDLKTGKEVLINKGSLLKAILASISLPGIFHPIQTGNKLLVDGGVVDPIPQKYGHLIAEKLIIVNAMPKKYVCNREGESVFEVLSEASGIMSNTLMNLENVLNLNLYKNKKFIFIQLKTEKIDPFDFYNVSKIIDIGRKAAKKEIKHIINLGKN